MYRRNAAAWPRIMLSPSSTGYLESWRTSSSKVALFIDWDPDRALECRVRHKECYAFDRCFAVGTMFQATEKETEK
jgi:hypothetical protein